MVDRELYITRVTQELGIGPPPPPDIRKVIEWCYSSQMVEWRTVERVREYLDLKKEYGSR